MAIIGNQQVKMDLNNPKEPEITFFDIAAYPEYKIKLVGNYDFTIIKQGEPEPYIPVTFSGIYAAVMAVTTIEAFKTLMRAKKAAKEIKENAV